MVRGYEGEHPVGTEAAVEDEYAPVVCFGFGESMGSEFDAFDGLGYSVVPGKGGGGGDWGVEEG